MPEAPPQPEAAPQLESGTYEILRNRLRGHGDELRKRLGTLNAARKDVFGSIDLKLLSTERITTENNCVPRDMVSIGNRFLFGYNVQFGLKVERNIADVFALYEFARNDESDQAHGLQPVGLDLINDAQFQKDFQDIYRYYKAATFSKFFVRGVYLYMVFQVGKAATDIKSFKWLIENDSLRYLDNRSDHEVRFPPQHEFEWNRTTRDMQRHGLHPHISIDDRMFVETVGGDLTIKIEDNTESGRGIYAEEVDDPDQTLDDAEIYYAIVGNLILLKIRPYQETKWRYIVYNEKIQQAMRVDSIEHACVLLPDDHGLIFSNGYYLQSGEAKTFESDVQGLKFERRVASPNGEDTLYVFYQPESGQYVLLAYNIIEQTVDTPVVCHGFTMFHAGEMLLFKTQHDPQKHHQIQVWQTPYVGEDFVPHQSTDSYLYKIGNRDIVRGMAECHFILGLIEKEDTYAGLYVDLVKEATDVLDSYFWINHEDAANLGEPLGQIKAAATSAVEEFEKVVRVRRNTTEQTQRVTNETRELLNSVGRARFETIDEFVQSLASLRRVRGEIIGLRDLRYVDAELVEKLEQEVTQATEELSQRCVEFLLRDDALKPYEQHVRDEQAGIEHLTKVADAKAVDEKIAASAAELEMLIEIVSNLKIDDATQRTAIIDNISAIFAKVNAARAGLKRKMQELASVEGAAEFSSQLKLLNQSVVNYIDVCDTPEKCEEYLTKLMVQVEELEGKFAEFDDFIVQLADKREEIASAFESRRMQLVEKRNKRAGALAQAADRILKGVKTRVESFSDINDIHGYFASDLMIEKVRDIIDQLGELGDSVKVDDVQSRLKTIREDAVRQLKDRQELYEDGEGVIRFGNHRFSVNTQVLDLTTVLREERLHLHLTGTDFYEEIESEILNATRDVWSMEVISENRDVYRAEYLAYQMLQAARNEKSDSSFRTDSDNHLADVQRFMGPRYSEGYTKGVHDHDAAIILRALLDIDANCGLLRYSSRARAMADVYWHHFGRVADKKLMASKLTGFGEIASLFPGTAQQLAYTRELRKMLGEFIATSGLFEDADESLLDEAATYLFHELSTAGDSFVIARAAAQLHDEFHQHLTTLNANDRFSESLKAVQKNQDAAFSLARDWVTAYVTTASGGRQSPDTSAVADVSDVEEQTNQRGVDTPRSPALDHIDEVAAMLISGDINRDAVVETDMSCTLMNLVGTHAVIDGGAYELQFNRFMERLERFERLTVPAYRTYHELKTRVVDGARDEMKLAEFQPRVLTSFVRNRLIDQVYLPLIGDNLAKQIGTAGADKRTDRQGLLLLISPPGYGKTTLMEYIANRLGIIFMKINGPAIGHEVTSLDPAAAPNAGAREEIEKLNLAFEMGDNVMIYLDDIQHCNTELLQKFISLCDAQRKVEGVYKGKTRTYDFRGRKVAVVMAGNPYTESGEKFQIPDMLANRADIYNLGEIIGDSADAFEMSYLENSLTSNPVLAKLAARSQQDVYAVIKMAQKALRGEQATGEGVDLEGSYAMEELNEFVAVMQKLMRVRDVVLKVNRAYIESAAQHDDYRTEPPFLLQGSYRNMNRIAEKVLPVMNDDELQTLIVSSYQNDAQTLTSGTEANLLKFKELIGLATEEEWQRWDDIKRTYRQNVKLRGIGSDDKTGQVIATLTTFADGLESIRKTLAHGVVELTTKDGASAREERMLEEAERLNTHLAELSHRLTDGVEKIGHLADRPIRMPPLEVPPIEMKWPEGLPAVSGTATPQASSMIPTDDPAVFAQRTPLEPMSSDPETKRITVVNRIPRTVLNVLEHQFELMEGWLRPLMDRSDEQRAELHNLGNQIEQCLKDYGKLLRRLEDAEEKEDVESTVE
ncbi:MAG: DNA repair ATPase [Planctomycetaceae bacterium]|nr:DNA repair ATPase [Planctomycetaceae bacterium]